jgi:4-hydroxymandelate oxidase
MTRWLDGLEERARQTVPPHILEYVLQGAGASVTAFEAPASWADVRLAPRVLRDVTQVDLTTRLLGHAYQVPWGVAPTTLQRSVHPDGEVAMARACVDAGSPLVVSSNAGTRFEAIGSTGVGWWLQIYLPRNRELAAPLLARAVAAGARAVVLTVDTPVVGSKITETGRSVFELVPSEQLRVNFDEAYDAQSGAEKAADLGPADIAWLHAQTGLPVVVKGVLRGDDARMCVEAGAAAIWVSNHGGRQLDRVVSTASALPRVRQAVGESVQVYVDGGIRSGLDILTALALGADAVFAGRPPLLALADGDAGVRRWHDELRTELTEAMCLSGATTPRDTLGLSVL